MDLSYSSPSPRRNHPFADTVAANMHDTSLNTMEAQHARSTEIEVPPSDYAIQVRAPVPERTRPAKKKEFQSGFSIVLGPPHKV